MAIKGYWRFNGNSNDASGNGYNGTDTNITYSQANGKLNKGAGFNGTSSKILISNAITRSGNTTVSAFIFVPVTWTGDYPVLFSHRLSNDSYRFDILPRHKDLSNYVQFQHFNGSSWYQLQSTYALPTGWHMLTVTYTPAEVNGMKIYIDGNINNQGNPASSFSITNGIMMIGTSAIVASQSTAWLNGAVDEVIIDNTAWPAAKIKNEYSRVKGFF